RAARPGPSPDPAERTWGAEVVSERVRGAARRAARRVLDGSRAVAGRARQATAPLDISGLDPVLAVLAQRAVTTAGPATLTAVGLRLQSPEVATVLGHVGRVSGRPRWLAGQATVLAGLGDPASRAEALALLRSLLA